MSNKSNKRSMLVCAITLLLCVSMVVGSTYAWFTDAIAANDNVIETGELKMTLGYKNNFDDAWTYLTGTTNTGFFNYKLWEPGYTLVKYFEVKNVGTLSFNYFLNITTDGADDLKLADVIDVYVADGKTEIATRADVANMNYVGTLTDVMEKEANGELGNFLKAGEADTVAVALKMKESAGNEYQALKLDGFDLELIAVQADSEQDSLGGGYDKDVSKLVYTPNQLKEALNAGKNVKLGSNINLSEALVIPAPATTFAMRTAPKAIVIDLNGYTIANENGYVIENQGNIVITGNGTIAGLGCIRSKAGSIVIENGNFYASSKWQDGVYQHTLKAENTNVTINGGNFDATVYGQTNAVLNASVDAVITINGGTFKNVDGALSQFDPYLFTYEKNGAVVINDGSFHGGWRFNGEATTTEIYGGNFNVGFDGQSFHANSTHKVTVYGGTFAADSKLAGKLSTIVASDYKAVETASGWMVVSSARDYVTDGVFVSTDNKTYYIYNANGYAWVDAQTDSFFVNKTVALDADIDFGGKTLTPIKFWNGKCVVDGQGYTLSNFVIGHSGSKKPSGLFSGTVNVQNLNVEKANVTGDYAGVISGNMYGNIVNCTVKNCVVNGTYWQSGALVGQYNSGDIKGCVVDNCTVSGGAAVGGLVGILNETSGVRNIENCTVTNTAIVMEGGFGGSYDDMFGIATGLVNIENSTVYFTDCTFENNTLMGETSNTLCGVVESGTAIIVDGALVVTNATDLQAAIAAGKSVTLTQDATLGKIDLTTITNDIVIDANGHKITTTDFYGVEVTPGKNITISNADIEMTKAGDYINYAAGLKIANGDYAGATPAHRRSARCR